MGNSLNSPIVVSPDRLSATIELVLRLCAYPRCPNRRGAADGPKASGLGPPVAQAFALPRRSTSGEEMAEHDTEKQANKVERQNRQDKSGELPPYQKPSIRVMDETEVLSAFQVTVAGVSWWIM